MQATRTVWAHAAQLRLTLTRGAMWAHLLLVFALISASVASTPVTPVVPTYISECHTTTQLHSNSSFVSVMNRCIAINSKISLPLDIVHQITDWLEVRYSYLFSGAAPRTNSIIKSRVYLQYCLLVLLAFSVLISAREDSLQLEVLARSHTPRVFDLLSCSRSLSHIRFSVALLLIRLASAITLATCLQLAFQQPSPCMCLIECAEDHLIPTFCFHISYPPLRRRERLLRSRGHRLGSA